MKKQKQKKAGAKKEEKTEPAESSTKVEESSEPPAPEPTSEDANAEEPKEAEEPEIKDADETSPRVSPAPHGRQPSLSLESKIRSASFRAGTGGPLSPNYGFSPEGDTAPDIYRKQAIRIEELEKENKRLAKEATDGERRWKKAEEELEEMREAEDEVAPKAQDTSGSPASGEVEKLVWHLSLVLMQLLCANSPCSGLRSQLYNAKIHNYKPNPSAELDMDHHHLCQQVYRQTMKPP